MVVIGDGFASVYPVDGLPFLALAAYEVDLADAIEIEKRFSALAAIKLSTVKLMVFRWDGRE